MPNGRLDPQVEKLLRNMEADGLPPLETLSPEAARQQSIERKKKIGGIPELVEKIINHQIPGPDGDISIRIYKPNHDQPLPVFIFYHGGGWVIGDLDSYDALCRSLANTSQYMVVAADYRLAPEHKFPAAVDDAVCAAKWITKEIQHFGGDPHHIAIGGDSAGGTLATVVAAKLRDSGQFPFACQILIYPVTDLSTFDTPSYRDFEHGYYLTKASMEWFRDHYLTDSDQGSHEDASPLLSDDLMDLPPALIMTAEFDPLRDEAEAYATRLKEEGVSVKLTQYKGMVHGFMSMATEVDKAYDAIAECADMLKNVFEKPS